MRKLNLNSEEVITQYKNGYPPEKIGKINNCCRSPIVRILKENSIDLRPKGCYRKHTLDEDVFEIIDTKEKAYWLGYIYADGYIYNANRDAKGYYLEISSIDREHLVKFLNFVNSDCKITKKPKQYNLYRIHISSKKFTKNLVKNGAVNKKSKIITFPNMPNELKKYFILGYFDGDGCMYISKDFKAFEFSIVSGSLKFLESIEKFLRINCNLNEKSILKKYGQYGEAYVLRYGGRLKTAKIMSYLYKNVSICLERKYHKFYQLYIISKKQYSFNFN